MMDKSRLDYLVGFYNRKKAGVHLGGLSFICIKIVRVTEARDKSGTLITVDMALEQGKEVYVVPGRITDRLSDSCNRLLKQGAGILLSPQEFLEEITELWHRRREPEEAIAGEEKETEQKFSEKVIPSGLSEELFRIWQLLDFTPKSAEMLGERLDGQYSIARLNAALMRLCLMGLAHQEMPGYFARKG